MSGRPGYTDAAMDEWLERMESVLGPVSMLMRGTEGHGLPEPVAQYLRGEAEQLPDDLGWIPEHARGFLHRVGNGSRAKRVRAEAANQAERRAEQEARAVLARIAAVSRR